MKISVHALCYNEEKLLPFYLRHYARFASRIVIWDNCSTDATVSIARSFSETEVVVRQFDSGNEFREDINIQIKNNCWKADDADWVVVCDVDEFIHAQDIRQFLARRSDFDVFRPVGFNMVSLSFPASDAEPITEQVKTGVQSDNYSKMVLFNPKCLSEIRYGPGAHRAAPIGPAAVRVFDARYFAGELKLLHYKNISFDYRMAKNNDYAPRVSEASKKANMNFHFSFDERRQRQEFDALWSAATQVIP